jgi:hypothetical protein
MRCCSRAYTDDEGIVSVVVVVGVFSSSSLGVGDDLLFQDR